MTMRITMPLNASSIHAANTLPYKVKTPQTPYHTRLRRHKPRCIYINGRGKPMTTAHKHTADILQLEHCQIRPRRLQPQHLQCKHYLLFYRTAACHWHPCAMRHASLALLCCHSSGAPAVRLHPCGPCRCQAHVQASVSHQCICRMPQLLAA
jgi:hypothetical protein